MRARVDAEGTILLEGTPEEIAAYRRATKPPLQTFHSFGERDNLRGDEPAEDGPIVQPDEPLILDE